MDIQLVMFKADGERRDFPITKEVTVLGRKHTVDLRVPIPSVSREHFQIERTDDALVIRDLGSSNGTFVNNRRVQEVELSPGDVISVGQVHFTVVIDGEPDEIEPIKTVLSPAAGDVEPTDEKPIAPDRVSELASAVAEIDDDEHTLADEDEDIDEMVTLLEADDDEDEAGETPTPPAPKGKSKAKPTERAEEPVPAADDDEAGEFDPLEVLSQSDDDDEDDDPFAALEALASVEDDDDEDDANDALSELAEASNDEDTKE